MANGDEENGNDELMERIRETDDPAFIHGHIYGTRNRIVRAFGFQRLVSFETNAEPGTVEREFWQMVVALEHAYFVRDHGRRVLAMHVRQMVENHTIIEAIEILVLDDDPGQGFTTLFGAGKPQCTVDAIVLRHQHRFDQNVVTRASERLTEARFGPDNP